MIIVLFWIVGMVGLTHIIVDSRIFQPIRDRFIETGGKISEAIVCHQCTGFWVGLTLWPTALPWLEISWTLAKVLTLPAIALLSGCAVSLLALAARAVIDWLTLSINVSLEDLELHESEKTK